MRLTPAVRRRIADWIEGEALALEAGHWNPRTGRAEPADVRREVAKVMRWAESLRAADQPSVVLQPEGRGLMLAQQAMPDGKRIDRLRLALQRYLEHYESDEGMPDHKYFAKEFREALAVTADPTATAQPDATRDGETRGQIGEDMRTFYTADPTATAQPSAVPCPQCADHREHIEGLLRNARDYSVELRRCMEENEQLREDEANAVEFRRVLADELDKRDATIAQLRAWLRDYQPRTADPTNGDTE